MWSPLHERAVVVGDNGQVGYIDRVDTNTANSWTQVSNGFSPLSTIKNVHWDTDQGFFIAVSNIGEICRSTNGTN